MKKLLLFIFMFFAIFSLKAQTELIQNGNFSSSSTWQKDGDWYISSSYTCYHSASGYAYVGNSTGDPINNAGGDLWQSITIPSYATSATLKFYYSITSQEVSTTTAFDYLQAFFCWNSCANNQMVVVLSNLDHTGSNTTGCNPYLLYTYNVPSTLFGLPLTFYFEGSTDGAKPTVFRVDDVSLTYVGTPCTPATSVTTQPQSQSICGGNSATLTVACNGDSPFVYTWHNGSGSTVGSNSPSYTTSTAGSYYCVITNCSGNNTVTSSTATITAGANPTTPNISGNTTFCAGQSTTLSVSNPCSGCTYTWSPSGSGQSISVSSAGTYTATAHNGCGDSSPSNSLNITVNPGPITPVISAQGGITSFCQGTGSATLQVTNSASCSGCSYSWYPSGTGTIIPVTSAGTYYCTASNACPGTSPQSNSIQITVKTVPTTSFTYNGSNCNYNFTDNSTNTPPLQSWSWNFGDPSSTNNTSVLQNPQHTFSGNGNFNVSLQASNECGPNSSSQNISVTNCETGIDEYNVTNIKNISIVPNPISNSALISFSVIRSGKISINLFDVVGKKIALISESEYSSGDYSIDYKRPNDLSTGTYFIKFISDNYSSAIKVVFN